MNSKPRVVTLITIAFLLSALFLAACSGQEEGSSSVAAVDLASETQVVPVGGVGTYTDVSAEGLALLLEDKDFPLINVHIPYEGEIEGTDDHIPFDQIEGNLDRLPADKGARIVIYCRSGSMSAISARALVNLGYSDVWNLDGGMIAWKDSGRPLIDN